jgi:hypothetical protein
MILRSGLVLGFAGLLTACGGGDDAPGTTGKGEAGPEPQLDNKADSFFQPTVFGTVEFGTTAKATLGEDARFHAFDFELTGDATVSLKTNSDNSKRDTVLYLYRAKEGGTWGRYLAKNDDDGRGLLSSIEQSLEAGSYRAIVKGYSRDETGDFSLTIDCAGTGCGPAQPVHVDACLFGDVYSNITANPNFDVVESRPRLTASALFQQGEDAAFIAAVAAQDLGDVDSLEKAFDAVDSGEFNYMLLRDVFDGQTYQVVEFGMGDTSVGAVLGKDNSVVAQIGDGDLWPCYQAEPEARFENLDFQQTDLPDPALSSFEAMKVVGLEPGQMFSLGSDQVVYEGLYYLFDGGCTGVLEYDQTSISRVGGYAVTDFFAGELTDWEGALSSQELAAFEAWADGNEDNLELWTAELDDRACGGDGAGVLAFVHDRVSQTVLVSVFVEWAE